MANKNLHMYSEMIINRNTEFEHMSFLKYLVLQQVQPSFSTQCITSGKFQNVKGKIEDDTI